MPWITEDTWVIADTHFYHDKLILKEYEDRPKHHNELMITNWQTLVQPNDHILHLGDVLIGGRERREAMAYRLTGYKYLILGNHDLQSRNTLRNDMNFAVLPDIVEEYINGIHTVFTHRPYELIKDYQVNIHGHIHSKKPPSFYTDRHINVSVEVMNYSPIKLGALLEERVN
jgi:calcineurin-like phosphoesterase family protein